MASLHATISETRSIFKWTGIGIAALFLLIVILRYAITAYIHFFPPPPPKPQIGYGKVPPIVFPPNVTDTHFTYTLNTVSGTLPALPTIVPIYRIIEPVVTLLSFSNTQATVNRTEFGSQPAQQIGTNLYLWTLPTSPFKQLIMDTVTNDLTITSQYLTDPMVSSAQGLPDVDGAKSIAENYLALFNAIPADIDRTKTAIAYFDINNGRLVPATSFSTTKVIRVDFYQNDRNKIPLYYPHPPGSTMNALIASPQQSPQVVEANYSGKNIDDTSNSTYPLLTAQEAFMKLQNGHGYIANYYPPEGTTSSTQSVEIQDVALGYYISDQRLQPYLMPIVIFTGNNGFIAYVSAVKDEWLGSPSSAQ